MSSSRKKTTRVLGIAPSSRGFGFALMDDAKTLVDWGVKVVKGDKNVRSLARIADPADQYEPTVIVLEEGSSFCWKLHLAFEEPAHPNGAKSLTRCDSSPSHSG